MNFYVHPTAEVSDQATIGEKTRIWHQVQIRERVHIGEACIIGKGAYIDFEVKIGNRCKLQNGVYVYHGATIEDGVFLGPGVMLLNDKNPRAITPEGDLKTDSDWEVSSTHIGYGAGVGGGAIILPGVSIGKWAIIGSGAVVTKNIPDYGLAYGNPARLVGFVSPAGRRMIEKSRDEQMVTLVEPEGDEVITVPLEIYQQIR